MLEVHAVVHEDQVGALALFNAAGVLVCADHAGRIDRTGGEGVGKGNAESQQIAKRLKQVRRAAGNGAVFQKSSAVFDRDLLAAEGVAVAVGAARARQRIADRNAAVGPQQAERQPHRNGVEVEAVADQLRGDARVFKHGADRAGRAVGERRHGVEQMGHVGITGVKGGPGFGVGGVGMRHTADDFAAERPRQRQRALHLRRGVHQPDRRNRVQRAHLVGIRRAQIGRVLGAAFRAGNVGALQIDAPDTGAVFAVSDGLHRPEDLAQLVVREGHCRRAPRGDAVGGVIARKGLQRFGRFAAAVGPRAAVGMDIDEARQTQQPVVLLAAVKRQKGGNAFALHNNGSPRRSERRVHIAHVDFHGNRLLQKTRFFW